MSTRMPTLLRWAEEVEARQVWERAALEGEPRGSTLRPDKAAPAPIAPVPRLGLRLLPFRSGQIDRDVEPGTDYAET